MAWARLDRGYEAGHYGRGLRRPVVAPRRRIMASDDRILPYLLSLWCYRDTRCQLRPRHWPGRSTVRHETLDDVPLGNAVLSDIPLGAGGIWHFDLLPCYEVSVQQSLEGVTYSTSRVARRQRLEDARLHIV